MVHLPVNRRHAAPGLAAEFDDLEIEFLDLAQRLPADADRFFFPNDQHFTEEGHRYVADRLSDELAR